MATVGNSAALAQLKRHERITTTMALIVIFTFIFVVIPSFGYMLGYILDTEYDYFGALGPFIGVILCSNSAINVLLYAAVNPELRGMFKRTLFCQNPSANSMVGVQSIQPTKKAEDIRSRMYGGLVNKQPNLRVKRA